MYNQGFTLLETLVAISILTLVLTGVTSLTQKSLQITELFRSNIIGAMLAQEGIEIIHNKRTTNVLTAGSVAWMNNLLPTTCTSSNNGCTARIDVATGDILFQSCPIAGCEPIHFDPATNIYDYAGPEVTSFVRTISIDLIGVEEVKIISKVEWSTRFGSRDIILESNLFNWQ